MLIKNRHSALGFMSGIIILTFILIFTNSQLNKPNGSSGTSAPTKIAILFRMAKIKEWAPKAPDNPSKLHINAIPSEWFFMKIKPQDRILFHGGKEALAQYAGKPTETKLAFNVIAKRGNGYYCAPAYYPAKIGTTVNFFGQEFIVHDFDDYSLVLRFKPNCKENELMSLSDQYFLDQY